MQLSVLLQDVKTQEVPAQDVEICSITDCARQVQPGDAFVCIPGTRWDGHDFAPQAFRQGAAVLVVQRRLRLPLPQVVVDDARSAYARMCGSFCGNPARRLRLTAITGTNGKTTTAWMLHHILTVCGYRTGRLGTIPDGGNDMLSRVHYTTPDPPVFHGTLQRMVEQGMTHAVLEASSQALDQRRLDGVRFACGVFTNLSPEHLDAHGDMTQYYRCKRRLFDQCDSAVICTDTTWGTRLARETDIPCVTVSAQHTAADYTVGEVAQTARATTFQLCHMNRQYTAQMPLTGRYNLSNGLCAIAAAEQCGVPVAEALKTLETLPVIPGRMERLALETPFEVFIDYAHTPEALRQVLTALRPVCTGRLTVVFGCGGDRDRSKRPEMGRIAAALADRVILTDDNPRSENPDRIRADIAAGMAEDAQMIPDRAQAIASAITEACPGDIVLLAGKGHEQYQIFSNGVRPLNEYRIAAEAAEMWKKGKE